MTRKIAEELFQKARAFYKAGKYVRSIELLNILAAQNHIGSLIFLGDCYFLGRGVIKNIIKSAEFFIKSGQTYNPLPYIGVPEHYKAFEWCLKAGKDGNIFAQYKVAHKYESSLDNENGEILDSTLEWYKMSAEKGYAPAQFNLGWYHENGELFNMQKNYDIAIKWYTKAAEQGFLQAQVELSRLYAEGKGTTQDNEKAVFWMNKALQKKHSKIQFKLYNMEIGDTIINKKKQKIHVLLTCSCNSCIECGLATDKLIYMDAFGRHSYLSNTNYCFNNAEIKTIDYIIECKQRSEKSLLREWKYHEK